MRKVVWTIILVIVIFVILNAVLFAPPNDDESEKIATNDSAVDASGANHRTGESDE